MQYAFMDGAFKCAKTDLLLMKLTLNSVAEAERVGEIEWQNRVVKECMRATMTMLPFIRVPPTLVIELAKREVFWSNSFPHEDGFFETLIPVHK